SFIPEYLLSNYAFIIGIIGVWITVKLIHKKTLTQVITGRRTFDYNRVVYAIWVGLIIFAFLLALDRLFFHSDIEFRSPNIWEYITFFLFAIVLTPYQAALEEILFRGYLFQGMALLTKNKNFLVASSAIFFTAIHLLNPEPYEYGFGPYVTGMMIFGIFVSLLTLLDGGIELAVGYHAVNNLWVALVVNTELTSMHTPSLFIIPIDGYEFFPGTPVELITLVIMFLVFNRKYQWINLSKLL
ncbi:MAG: CPBP family intramembrane metalloprotease, partial [Anaerolineales bacterium]|nr:CPBP family intramembrane metalloprotease [Anaerolineales bacterium]